MDHLVGRALSLAKRRPHLHARAPDRTRRDLRGDDLLASLSFHVGVAPQPPNTTTRFMLGAANASFELGVGDGYFLDADDDTSQVRLYAGGTTRYPVSTWTIRRTLGSVRRSRRSSTSRRWAATEPTSTLPTRSRNSPGARRWSTTASPGPAPPPTSRSRACTSALSRNLRSRGWSSPRTAPPLTWRSGYRWSGCQVECTDPGADHASDQLQPAVQQRRHPRAVRHADVDEPGRAGIREIRKNAANQYLILSGPPGDSPTDEPPQQGWWSGTATSATSWSH